jgi:hypothetical protein
MIRAWRRRWRRWDAEQRIAGRRDEICQELAGYFKRPIRLVSAGARGRDAIYRVDDDSGPIAFLRLLNPHLRRTQVSPDMPFVLPEPGERLEHEWQCYARGSAVGVTPTPLWRTDDALVCEFVRGPRLHERFAADPTRFWLLLTRASAALARLHHQGLSHMDASLANMIEVPSSSGNDRDDDHRIVLIDFEYAPARDLTFAAQKVYDHLRLVESTIKFMPPGMEVGVIEWCKELDRYIDRTMSEVGFGRLAKSLERVLGNETIRGELARRFAGLVP